MSIGVQCPGCDKKLKTKDELAGKRVKCPSCGQAIVIPVAHPASQVNAPVESEEKADHFGLSSSRSRGAVRGKPRSAWLGYAVCFFAILCGLMSVLTMVGAYLLLQGSIETENKILHNPRPGVVSEHIVSSWSPKPPVVIVPGVAAVVFGGCFLWTFSRWKSRSERADAADRGRT